ncbi:DegV family protein [Sulfidibacter corallicola]|uniref:DegV family protein n=1 Tax=Sulfidibacter corallicola TaxID=2818388 RepID=A0A8A4TJV5_SULCO|nr:DegV family protein [Sulfidibacter corallicola]QTD49830.1 DegV family protein [Sulfidibacter corallicola]
MPIPHILYLDNHFEDKKKMVILLFSNGYEVMPVSNLKEGLAALRVGDFDLIICDMHLPDGDADNLIQTVKSASTLNKIPVMVVTSHPSDADTEMVMKLGAADYMPKDTDPNTLLRRVKETVNLHRRAIKKTSAGISGQLAKLKIVDLIMQLSDEHSSGCITIDGQLLMEIHLRDGQIVHARHGITLGKKALFRLLRIAEAAFHFQADSQILEHSIDGELDELLEEARVSNEKLMANWHKLPNANFRVRIANPEVLSQTNFKPEVRAALEIIKKYPRIGTYVDRLNLPDVVCYEYLHTFLERGLIELVTEHKPVKILTDVSCDLPKEELYDLGVVSFNVALKLGGETFDVMDPQTESVIYTKKPKQLETLELVAPPNDEILDRYVGLLPNHDCLAITMASSVGPLFETVQGNVTKLQATGLNGKSLLANETTTINSHSFSLGLGLLVRYAAQLAEEGHQAEVIEERLINAISQLHMIFVVNAERGFLAKKGQCIMYWNGLEFEVVQRLDRKESALTVLADQVERRIDLKAGLHMSLGHVRNRQQGEALRLELGRRLSTSKVPLRTIGPVAGYQLGEGALGVAFFQE